MEVFFESINRKLSTVYCISIHSIEENVFFIGFISHWQNLLVNGQALRLGLEKIERCLYFVSRLSTYLGLDPQFRAFFDIIISTSIDSSFSKFIGD